MASGVSLEEAVRAAVEQGHAELAQLDDITQDLVGEFGPTQSGPVGRLDDFVREFTTELRAHLDREREALGSFNIAFFGRTGAGKSTLLSAFGRLDGAYVSPGASDWTTEVHPVGWRDCRLFDTPGINGWGRTESRDDLEAKARRAVEVADIVLLCFDTQSQQEMEFAKIAAWIRDHGKPAVAVLNVRNPRWRHPAKVPEMRRRNPSEAVRQHTGNIRTQLAQIGLPDTPVVAIHSRRALLARASIPFRGPNPEAFRSERDEFGADYHERWSNFTALERLLVASIAEGGADLRLSALREDLRSRSRRGITELDDLADEIEREAESLEREVESLFALLGYPDEVERALLGPDLLAESERARGRPYTSPAKGALDRYVRHLAASHLAGCRRQAKIAADGLIRTAFDERTVIAEARFAEAVFDQDAIAAAAEAVQAGRRVFLHRELDLAVDHSMDDGPMTSHTATILGDKRSSAAGEFVRGGGIAIALAVPAAALFWNPAGWVLGAAAAGAGLAGQLQQYFGRKMSRQKAEQEREARAQAIADCHRAVDMTFTEYEDAFARDSRYAAWALLAPAIGESLRASVERRVALARLGRLAAGLRTYADAIRPAPAVTDVLQRAQRRMGDSTTEVTRTLLGEDWLGPAIDHSPAPISPAVREIFTRRAESDRDRLTRAVAAAWQSPPAVKIQSWYDDLEDAVRHDPELDEIGRIFRRVSAARPALTVLGDFSSGKSSLIRRVMVDAGLPGPSVVDIRASPATTAASRHAFARFELVDTPGLQSGDGEHDAAALEASVEAALVLVVVHINLLVGNSSMLEELAQGSDLLAAKGVRMVFLINRCDELGLDPLTAPEAFLNLIDRKREELRAAFAVRGFDVALDRIHCLSGDPFGLVAAETTATSGDFDENRLWDGVYAVTGALAALSDEQVSAAASAAAFDSALTALKRRHLALRQLQADGTSDLLRSEPVVAAVRAAVTDAGLLDGSLRVEARRMVDRHLVAAKAAVAKLDRKGGTMIEQLVESWWKAPEFEADLERYLADAARRLDEWHGDHVSAIGRETRAAAFHLTPEFAVEFKACNIAKFEVVAEGAGNVAGVAAPLVKALGNRDAVYAIGKQIGHKFKPWGAVKGGTTVARAGFVLAVVAAAVDAATMAADIRKAGQHHDQQEAALRVLDETADRITEQIMRGAEGDGPVAHLEQRIADLDAMLDEHLDLQAAVQARRDEAAAQAEAARSLIGAAEIATTEGNV